jgi:hypothetical protein
MAQRKAEESEVIVAETKIDFEHLSVSEALKQLDVDLKIGDVGVADDRHVGQDSYAVWQNEQHFRDDGQLLWAAGRGEHGQEVASNPLTPGVQIALQRWQQHSSFGSRV